MLPNCTFLKTSFFSLTLCHTTLRLALNAALPEASFLCRDCPLFRAIVAQNMHLRNLYRAAPESGPPIAPSNKLKTCPTHLSTTYREEVLQLEEILPNSRNLDFVELNQLISMAPYIILPSLPSFSRRFKDGDDNWGLRRVILVDVGANNFYG